MPVRPSTPAQREAVRRYDMTKVERINARLPIGTREIIKPTGMSVNAFVVQAVTEKIDRMSGNAADDQVLLPEETLTAYRQAAEERGMTLEELITEAVKIFIKEY